jgi:5-(carboxyamino)imidazole ribonucleotide synthase
MSVALKPLLPGSTLGVLGGGQLGRMWAHTAQRMGYYTAVLDPDAQSPAGLVSHHHIHTAYLDTAGLQQLASVCQAVTTEFENVPADALAQLATTLPVSPAASAVPVAPHAVIDTAEQLPAVSDDLLPGILKTSRMGYDGKGQLRVTTRDELNAGWAKLGSVPCVLEKMLPLASECSVIVARGRDGAMVNLPVQRNLHRDGILAVTEWSFLYWPMAVMWPASWWSMKLPLVLTTAVTTAKTLAMCRSSNCKCAPWPICRSPNPACTARL